MLLPDRQISMTGWTPRVAVPCSPIRKSRLVSGSTNIQGYESTRPEICRAPPRPGPHHNYELPEDTSPGQFPYPSLRAQLTCIKLLLTVKPHTLTKLYRSASPTPPSLLTARMKSNKSTEIFWWGQYGVHGDLCEIQDTLIMITAPLSSY